LCPIPLKYFDNSDSLCDCYNMLFQFAVKVVYFVLICAECVQFGRVI